MLIRQSMFFLFSLFLLASCSRDGDVYDPGGTTGAGEEIRFEIGFDPLSRVATDAEFYSKWEIGDQIGVYIVKGDGGLQPSNNYVDNMKLKRTATGWDYTLPPNSKYYPKDGSELCFYAYYPYNPSMSDPTNYLFSVNSDQSDGTDYNKSDLLLAKAENRSPDPAPVPLLFSHALAMVQVEVDTRYILPENDMAVVFEANAVKLNVNIGTGDSNLSSETQSFIFMYRLEQSGDADYSTRFTFRALLPAQEIPPRSLDYFFRIQNGSTLFRCSSLGVTSFTAGRVTRFSITPRE